MKRPGTHTHTDLPQRCYKLLLLLAAAIWGLGTCVIKDTVDAFPPAWLMGLRFFSAGIIILLVCWRRIRRFLNRDVLIAGSVIGLAIGPAYLCNTIGLAYTTASKSAFLTSTYVVMVPFIAWAVSQQRPTSKNLIAAFVAAVGVAFVSFASADTLQSEGFSFGIGEGLTLLSAFFLGLHLAISARLSVGRDPLTLTAIQFIVGGLVGMAFAYATCGPVSFDALAQPDVLANLAYLVIFASCIALSLQNIGVKHVAAAPAALFLSTEGLFGAIFAVILFGDAITPFLMAGFACIAASIVINEAIPAKGEIDRRRQP